MTTEESPIFVLDCRYILYKNGRCEYTTAIPRRLVTGFSVAVSDIVHRSNIEDHAGVGNGCNTPDNGQSWIRSGLKERFSGFV